MAGNRGCGQKIRSVGRSWADRPKLTSVNTREMVEHNVNRVWPITFAFVCPECVDLAYLFFLPTTLVFNTMEHLDRRASFSLPTPGCY